MNELSSKLKTYKGNRTQQEIADLAGIAQRTYARAEAGESVKVDTLEAIAKALKLSDEDWMSLLISWLKNEAGKHASKVQILPNPASTKLSEQDELLSLFHALTPKDRSSIIKAMKRPEILRTLESFNDLYDGILEIGTRSDQRKYSRSQATAPFILNEGKPAKK